jgi:hypothetical protein
LLTDFRKSIGFWKVPRLRPIVLLVRAACRWRWVWSVGRVILTGEPQRNRNENGAPELCVKIQFVPRSKHFLSRL